MSFEHETLIPTKDAISHNAHVNAEKYRAMYEASVKDPEVFWAQQAKTLHWQAPFHTVKNTDYTGDVSIKWFEGGKLNVAENCIDRHLPARGNDTAIIWEGDEPSDSKHISLSLIHI